MLKVFVEFYDEGLIFRGKRLVNWDPHFETAISDLEVEKVEVPGHMWHFALPARGRRDLRATSRRTRTGTSTLRETRD